MVFIVVVVLYLLLMLVLLLLVKVVFLLLLGVLDLQVEMLGHHVERHGLLLGRHLRTELAVELDDGHVVVRLVQEVLEVADGGEAAGGALDHVRPHPTAADGRRHVEKMFEISMDSSFSAACNLSKRREANDGMNIDR